VCSLVASTHGIYIRSHNLQVVNLHCKPSRVTATSRARSILRLTARIVILSEAAGARTNRKDHAGYTHIRCNAAPACREVRGYAPESCHAASKRMSAG
jgi:hypothetical protein